MFNPWLSKVLKISDRTLIELLHGNGAHANTLACVEVVQPELAGGRADNFPHSIWQLVNHMNFWMAYELERIGNESLSILRTHWRVGPPTLPLLRKKIGKRLSPYSEISSRGWPTRRPIVSRKSTESGGYCR